MANKKVKKKVINKKVVKKKIKTATKKVIVKPKSKVMAKSKKVEPVKPAKVFVKKKETPIEKENKIKFYESMESVKRDLASGAIKEGEPWQIIPKDDAPEVKEEVPAEILEIGDNIAVVEAVKTEEPAVEEIKTEPVVEVIEEVKAEVTHQPTEAELADAARAASLAQGN